jgi:hypothetical protein
MTLGIRKLIVVSLVAGLFLLANLWLVVNWLNNLGVIVAAQYVRHEYLTGTAITIIVVLLILLVGQGSQVPSVWARRCSVCGERLGLAGKYCSACGSRV